MVTLRYGIEYIKLDPWYYCSSPLYIILRSHPMACVTVALELVKYLDDFIFAKNYKLLTIKNKRH